MPILKANTESEEQDLQELIGRQLGAVVFVQDYVQFQFDGIVLTAVTLPTVALGGREFRWGDAGYRDELCARIAQQVLSATIVPVEALQLQFTDGASFRISLKEEDYEGEEAVRFDSPGETWWVL